MPTPPKGITWSLETFGLCGPPLRRLLHGFIRDTHQNLATAQTTSKMKAKNVYGNVGPGVAEALPEAVRAGLPAHCVEVKHLPTARYQVAVVNGVPLYAVRYSATAQDPDGLRLQGLSHLRKGVLDKSNSTLSVWSNEDRLPLEWDTPPGLLTSEEQQIADDLARVREDLEFLRTVSPSVVLVLFASNPDALHRVGWGTGYLDSDDVLRLSGDKDDVQFFYENLPLTTNESESTINESSQRSRIAVGQTVQGSSEAVAASRANGGFADGAVPEPPVRPRPNIDTPPDTP